LPQIATKNDSILEICKTDLNIIKLWTLEIERRLWDKEELEKMKTFEISQVIRENTARYSLFKWNATDQNWWLKDITSILSELQWQKENN
jgi:hypothetical protein